PCPDKNRYRAAVPEVRQDEKVSPLLRSARREKRELRRGASQKRLPDPSAQRPLGRKQPRQGSSQTKARAVYSISLRGGRRQDVASRCVLYQSQSASPRFT